MIENESKPRKRSRIPIPDGAAALRELINSLRTQIIGGLVLALPIVLTFLLIFNLYLFFKDWILDPATYVVQHLQGYREGFDIKGPWARYGSPLIAIVLVCGLLYLLGLFARSGLRKILEWILLHMPGVTFIYKFIQKTVSSLLDSLKPDSQSNIFRRVVLVPFPHPGSKALGFVTRTLSDVPTGRVICCVCVLNGVIPPTGFTLYVPEEELVDVDWSVSQALEAILSGGINTPAVIHYSKGIDVPPTGPILDASGNPIAEPSPTPVDELA